MEYGFAALVLIWSLSMTLARVAQLIFLEFGTTIFQDVSTSELIQAMWMGYRFDLLVVGFVWLPITALTLALKIYTSRFGKEQFWNYHFVACRYYFPAAWALIALIMFKDSLQFLIAGSRVRAAEHLPQMMNIAGLFNQASVLLYSFLVFLIMWIVGHIANRNILKRMEWVNTKWFYMLGFLLLAGLLARGTLAPHHLAQEHCEIGDQRIVRELCLNAVWTMNKYE